MPAASQGWKLYISASNANFEDTLRLVTPIFEAQDLPFKFIANARVLHKINAGLYGYSQIGKTIVVYFEDDTQVASVVERLKLVLARFAGSAILPPFANRIGGGLPLSYRYGSFSGDTISLGGQQVVDDRFRRTTEREGFPPDPFLAFVEPPGERAGLEQLLLTYPVYEVLSQSAKGGVYAAMDLTSPQFHEVILKVGRRNGNILPDGRDALDLVRQESWFYMFAATIGLAEHLAGFQGLSEFPDAAVLIIERLDGSTLQAMLADQSLEPRHLTEGLGILRRFHASGLLVGDAKVGNFVQTSTGLKVIDFESGCLASERSGPDQHCTFLFVNHALHDRPADLELLHFLYSAIHREDTGSFNDAGRIIDLGKLLSEDTGSSLEGIAAAALAMMHEVVAAANGAKRANQDQVGEILLMSSPAA